MQKTPQEVKNNDDDESYDPIQRPTPVGPPPGRLIVKRNGHSITRKIPKPIVLIDTREKSPFNFSRFQNWIAEEKSQTLKVGDYSVEGMETLLVLERKTLADLITTLIQHRERFFSPARK
jgi:ERCC4-type nuclease